MTEDPGRYDIDPAVDPMAAAIKQANAGDTDAIAFLLLYCADHLADSSNAPHEQLQGEAGITFNVPTSSGSIPDSRVSWWLVNYLAEHADTLTRTAGSPRDSATAKRNKQIAIQVSQLRESGMTRKAAIQQAAYEHSISFDTARNAVVAERKIAQMNKAIRDSYPKPPTQVIERTRGN